MYIKRNQVLQFPSLHPVSSQQCVPPSSLSLLLLCNCSVSPPRAAWLQHGRDSHYDIRACVCVCVCVCGINAAFVASDRAAVSTTAQMCLHCFGASVNPN